MDEYMKTLEDVLVNNFSVFGAEAGFNWNVSVIMNWREEQEINDEQFHELRRFNRKVYSNLPLNM